MINEVWSSDRSAAGQSLSATEIDLKDFGCIQSKLQSFVEVQLLVCGKKIFEVITGSVRSLLAFLLGFTGGTAKTHTSATPPDLTHRWAPTVLENQDKSRQFKSTFSRPGELMKKYQM